jgi:hypothetical protein
MVSNGEILQPEPATSDRSAARLGLRGANVAMGFFPMRFATLCVAMLVTFDQGAATAAQSITCTYANGQALTFDVPNKLGDLPSIGFDYPSKVTLFSFRDNNLLLVAVDEAEKSRVRIVISAQHGKGKASYDGQILIDSGGNAIMLDNGPVSCKAD